MKNILQKMKEEFFSEPLKFFLKRNFKKKKSDVIFMLHFNQSYSDYFDVAYKVCYLPLLKCLSEFKEIKMLLNFSYSFVENLKDHKEGYDLYKGLIRSGNVKNVRSYYSQHVPGILDREIDIALMPDPVQKESVFWLPERAYSKDIISEVCQKGYSTVFLERFYKESESFIKINNLKVLPDEVHSRYLIDGVILSGRNVFKTRNYIYSKKLTVYAEDAEVSGLWNYEKGKDYTKDIQRLHSFLKWIQNDPNVSSIFPEEMNYEYKKKRLDDIDLEFHIAQWIDEIFQGKINQYYEKGYKDYNDYLNSNKILNYKKSIEEIFINIKKDNIPGFVKESLEKMFILHLYEFGCPGVGFEDRYLWAGIDRIRKYYLAYISDQSLFTQGCDLAFRKIYLIKKDNMKIFIDEFGQIVSLIDEKKQRFYNSEIIIPLNKIYDSEYPAFFIKTNIFECCKVKIKEDRAEFSNFYYTIEYSFEEGLSCIFKNNTDKKMYFQIKEKENKEVESFCSVKVDII